MRFDPQTGFQWLILSCGVVLLALVVVTLERTAHPQGFLTLDAAQFLPGERAAVPVDARGWRAQTLPHDWSQRDAALRTGWYRFPLSLDRVSHPDPDRQWAVYLPTVYMNAAVYLNGHLLGLGGRFTAPVARHGDRPLYFIIPNGLLHAGENNLDVNIKTDIPGDAFLSTLYVGEANALLPVYEMRAFVKATLKQFITLGMLVAAVFMTGLWLYRRDDTVYGWFALTIFVWALHNVSLIVANIPLPSAVWDWLRFTSVLWFIIIALMFIRRFLAQRTTWLEYSLAAVGGLASLALAVADVSWMYWLGKHVTDVVTLAIGAILVGCVVREQFRRYDADVFLLMVTGFVVFGLGAYDVLAANHLVDAQRGFLLVYGAPMFLFSFATILLGRYLRALTEAEALQRDLGERIEARSEALARDYDRLRALERQRVLVEERERIMRDMHDGIGGHLVSTLALIESGETRTKALSAAVRRALDDLRLMIDSLEEVEGDLLTVLGAWRQRVEPYLVSAGLHMDWHVQEVPRLTDFGPQKALQLMRILQEAVANIIKHAGADTVTVETRLAPRRDGSQGVCVTVSDNGRGLCTGGISQVPGRGLYNMRRRAQAIAAALDVQDTGRGTRVVLSLPL